MTDFGQVVALLNEHQTLSIDELKERLNFSERKVREVIKGLRDEGETKGFEIKTITKQGYHLIIHNRESFLSYQESLNQVNPYSASDKDYRQRLILYLLLQNKGYISIQQIADILDVSRSTVISDLKVVKRILQDNHISLISKPHFGLHLKGKELAIRKLFSEVALKINQKEEDTTEYFAFVQTLAKQFKQVEEEFKRLLAYHRIEMNRTGIESMMLHLQILVFRVSHGNEIAEVTVAQELIGSKKYLMAQDLLVFLGELFELAFDPQEVHLLASQIFSKATSVEVPEVRQVAMKKMIATALARIDQEHGTNYSNDQLLKECLLLHIYPLILRTSFGLELKNSLITSISVQYSNSFLISLQFIDYHEELSKFQLSRDEIGYLALHFAAHQEREYQQKIREIRQILLVTEGMRSNSLLMKARLENHFPQAEIQVSAVSSLPETISKSDLVLSTIPVKVATDVPVFTLSENPNEGELQKLKNILGMHLSHSYQKTIPLQHLFCEELFFVEEQEQDYLTILAKYARKMVNLGFANEDFPESLLNREQRFSTVYDNGVAGPHSMRQDAQQNSMAVIVLPNPLIYEGKIVKSIFMINVKAKQFFLHREISELLIKVMERPELVQNLSKSRSYGEFCHYLAQVQQKE